MKNRKNFCSNNHNNNNRSSSTTWRPPCTSCKCSQRSSRIWWKNWRKKSKKTSPHPTIKRSPPRRSIPPLRNNPQRHSWSRQAITRSSNNSTNCYWWTKSTRIPSQYQNTNCTRSLPSYGSWSPNTLNAILIIRKQQKIWEKKRNKIRNLFFLFFYSENPFLNNIMLLFIWFYLHRILKTFFFWII